MHFRVGPEFRIRLDFDRITRRFVLLVHGTVRVYESGEAEREIVLYRVRAGELCVPALTNLTACSAYIAGATAEEGIEIVIIPIRPFNHVLAHSEAFRTFVLSIMARRLGELNGSGRTDRFPTSRLTSCLFVRPAKIAGTCRRHAIRAADIHVDAALEQ